jgi:hypothetical protein
MKTTEAGELWDQSLRLTEITRKLKTEAGNATHFVVFDACRNKLRLTRAGSRTLVHSKGFVPVAHENGILIAYATAEDKLASDVGAGAGPYAQALAEEIAKPGVECGGNVSQCATTCARHHWSGAMAELRSAQSRMVRWARSSKGNSGERCRPREWWNLAL